MRAGQSDSSAVAAAASVLATVLSLACVGGSGATIAEQLNAFVDTTTYEQLLEQFGTPTSRLDGQGLYVVTWREVEPGNRSSH